MSFGETRHSTILPNTWKMSVAFCTVDTAPDSLNAGANPSFTISTGMRKAIPIRHGILLSPSRRELH